MSFRPIKRLIQQEIENPLAKGILEGRFNADDKVGVDVQRGTFIFSRGTFTTPDPQAKQDPTLAAACTD